MSCAVALVLSACSVSSETTGTPDVTVITDAAALDETCSVVDAFLRGDRALVDRYPLDPKDDVVGAWNEGVAELASLASGIEDGDQLGLVVGRLGAGPVSFGVDSSFAFREGSAFVWTQSEIAAAVALMDSLEDLCPSLNARSGFLELASGISPRCFSYALFAQADKELGAAITAPPADWFIAERQWYGRLGSIHRFTGSEDAAPFAATLAGSEPGFVRFGYWPEDVRNAGHLLQSVISDECGIETSPSSLLNIAPDAQES